MLGHLLSTLTLLLVNHITLVVQRFFQTQLLHQVLLRQVLLQSEQSELAYGKEQLWVLPMAVLAQHLPEMQELH